MANGLGIIDDESLNIFTDGSSFPHRKRDAGVGFVYVWVNESGNEETDEYSPLGWQSSTIDEMEIKACALAIRHTNRIFPDLSRFKKILIFSDSRYVVDNYFKAMNIWPKCGWRKSSNDMTVANIDLWKELRRVVNKCPIRVDIEWVKSHKDNIHNRAANDLARESASMPFNRPLSISGTTRKWSERKTKRGCVQVLGQVTKIRIISWKYLKRDKTFEYRYEIIDPDDRNYKDLDFLYYSDALSRNKCYQVRFNTDQSKPSIDEIIIELECAEYKY